MRKKLFNSDAEKSKWATRNTSNIRRYFGPMIDLILTQYPRIPGQLNSEEMLYLENQEVKNILHEIIKSEQSNFWQIVGYKGTGKTTTIKGCLKLWGSQYIKLVENTMIVYCSFNTDQSFHEPRENNENHISEYRNIICGYLLSAQKKIRAEQDRRGGVPTTEIGLHEFLDETKPDLLSRYSDKIQTDSCDPKISELRALEQSNRLVYCAMKLKYEISNLKDRLVGEEIEEISIFNKKQIVLIFDDIEGISKKEDRRSLYSLMLPLWNCFRNDTSHPTKLLIAHRPYTRDEITQNAVLTPINVEFQSNLTIGQIIEKRFEIFLAYSDEGKKLKERDSWQKSYETLTSLLTKYSHGEKHEIILSMFNNCYRDSVSVLSSILQGNQQRNTLSKTDGGVFSLEDIDNTEHLKIPRANLIETIGRRGYKVFSPDEKCGIVNIFENDPDDTSHNFAIFLMIHWAWNKIEKKAARPTKLLDIQKLKNNLKIACPTCEIIRGDGKVLEWAVRKAEKNGLLDDVIDLYDTTVILHHLMPRSDLIYQEIGHSSAILELGLEDFYFEKNEHAYLSETIDEKFLNAIKFCRLIYEFDKKLSEICIDKTTMWSKIYYRKLLSRHAYTGIDSTWRRWNRNKPQAAWHLLHDLDVDISNLEKCYGK